ncbi:MAG: hypothetical protein AAFR52_06475, partial [Pseudomonadota bacterium]
DPVPDHVPVSVIVSGPVSGPVLERFLSGRKRPALAPSHVTFAAIPLPFSERCWTRGRNAMFIGVGLT